MSVTILRKVPFKAALAILVVIPIVAMTFFAGRFTVEQRSRAAEADRLQTLVDLGVRVGNLLHETQKERGATALYVSSGGERFVAELPAQQEATNGPRQELLAFIDANRSIIPDEVQAELNPAIEDLAELDEVRATALGLEAPTAELIAWYVRMNSDLLDAVAATATATTDAQLRNDVLAYVTFLNAKERTGIERAQLSAVFANDGFAPGQFATVVSLIATQDAYLGLLEDIANPDVLAFFEAQQADPVVEEVARLEAIALETDVDAEDFDGFGVEPEVWFDTITERINLLKGIEDYQADSIIAGAEDLAGSAGRAALSALILTLLGLAATVAIAILVIRSIIDRLSELADRATQIAAGQLDVEPIEVHVDDEIGHLEQSFVEMTDVLVAVGAQAEAIASGHISGSGHEDHIPGALGESFRTMTSSLRTMVGEMTQFSAQLADAAGHLTTTSESMGSSATQTSDEATTASNAGEAVSASVIEVASSVEEMDGSIREVAANANEASRVASEAVEVARHSSRSISKLGESSEEIGNVIKVINSIAEQTNLLALNATIEAARAGEAGKGFAVVANEVKELATQTATATEEISSWVTAIQADTSGAVEANLQIGETIDRINEISTAIAAAVEEQSTTTATIGYSVKAAATGTNDISRSISDVATAATETKRSSVETRQAADDISSMAESLRALVSVYR